MTSPPTGPMPRARPFADRAAAYAAHRPGYPSAIVPLLEDAAGLRTTDRVVDLGTGTGLFARPFVERGYAVVGVEPDPAMAAEARASLAAHARFRVVAGRAEATGLAEGHADVVTIAQALHWFDLEAARREITRILAPGGRVVVAWNARDPDAPINVAYDRVLAEHGVPRTPRPALGAEALSRLLGEVRGATVPNPLRCDRARFIGRTRSAAGTPPGDAPAWVRLAGALGALFDTFEAGGAVWLPMTTHLRWGRDARRV